MSDLDVVEASRRAFPPRPESAAAARRFVRDRLAGDAAPDVVETAELLVSELVTNAVLHARTETEVSVRSVSGEVRVGVRDRAPRCGLAPRHRHPFTDTGRGLYFVERLASRYGVDTGEQGKTVWFELGRPRAPSTWGPSVSLRGPRRSVTLIDVPWALAMAARQHRHAILRELVIAAEVGRSLGLRPDDLDTAHDVNNALTAWVTAAAEEHPSDQDIRTLALSVPADAAAALGTLRRVLDLAEEAAREERLLTRPALPQSSALRGWMLDEVLGQLGGEPPTAWTVVPRDPTAGPLDLMPWDADQVRAGRLPTVAVDDGNRIIAVNEAAADLLGWEADDLVGRRLTVLVPEHLRERHLAAFTSLLLTGRPRILGRPVPLPALHSDGRQIPVRLLIQSQELDDGRTLFVAQLIPRTAAPEPPPAEDPEGPERDREAERQRPDRPLPRPLGRGEWARGPGTDMSALERLSLLADSERALSGAQDLAQGLRSVCRMLTRRLADWCAVDLFDEHGNVERAAVVHHDPALPSPGAYERRPHPLSESARGPLARALRGAGPLLLTDGSPPDRSGSPLDDEYAALFEALGANSAVIAPLRAHRNVLGALTLGRISAEHVFVQGNLDFVRDLARRLALGVENARLFNQAVGIAERLQHSLLPALPTIENLQLAARYAPSAIAAQVGGDWYDAFVLPGGDTALVIGDVAGHDIDASAAMSRLSSMMRGVAVVRQEPPEEVVHLLDMANRTLPEEITATCVYATVKEVGAGGWELAHSSAGHPPPLLTSPDGDTRFLDGGTGLMLGTGVDLPRPTVRTPLPAHSTVLLYTDGLIERRDEPIDRSLERLREHTAPLAQAPLDVFCDELLIRLGADNADDIALLAVRPAPPP